MRYTWHRLPDFGQTGGSACYMHRIEVARVWWGRDASGDWAWLGRIDTDPQSFRNPQSFRVRRDARRWVGRLLAERQPAGEAANE